MKPNIMKLVSGIIVVAILGILGIAFLHQVQINQALETALTQSTSQVKQDGTSAIEEAYLVSGVLTPIETYVINASVVGAVSNVYVKNGDVVHAGDLLLKQDPTDVLLQAGNGSTTDEMLNRLKLAYATALDTYETNQALYKEGAISEAIYKQSLTQKENAELQYRGALNSIAELKAKTIVKSPGDGIVTGLAVKEGDRATAGTPLLNVVKSSTLQLKGNVPERWLSRLTPGMEVEVFIQATGQSYPGTLTYISPVSVASGQMFPLEISLKNEQDLLKSGMACSVSFAP